MKIVVAGVGDTGLYLADILLKDGHDLVLIEANEKRCKYAQERMDAQIIHGDGARRRKCRSIGNCQDTSYCGGTGKGG